ncbi:MAG: regulatory iron-sulfur-containing complex subunit RicT [Myxococcales bacterium]|nr:hypothetical protein [Myxococcota bacterium]MDW8282632.1 regulatory iron-sulfur-containing complex subunit RicT [Myxococcales bacterium]
MSDPETPAASGRQGRRRRGDRGHATTAGERTPGARRDRELGRMRPPPGTDTPSGPGSVDEVAVPPDRAAPQRPETGEVLSTEEPAAMAVSPVSPHPEPPAPPQGCLRRVVRVRFRPGGPVHSLECDEVYQPGDLVQVETDSGVRTATVVSSPGWSWVRGALRRVLRRARPDEERSYRAALESELEALRFCRERARERQLPLKVVRVEISPRAQRATVYFASEERLDLRELVRDLSQRLRLRIELRQIGVRDEARLVGGIGDCGRELCCSTWLPAFAPVSIKMAKDQGIVLNPSRLAGQCGRLKCCLVYEHHTYKEMGKNLPKVGKRVNTPAGIGRVLEVDILGQRVRVGFDEGRAQVFPGAQVTPLSPPAGTQPRPEDGTEGD